MKETKLYTKHLLESLTVSDQIDILDLSIIGILKNLADLYKIDFPILRDLVGVQGLCVHLHESTINVLMQKDLSSFDGIDVYNSILDFDVISEFFGLFKYKPFIKSAPHEEYTRWGYWFPLNVEGNEHRIKILEEIKSKLVETEKTKS